jgi:hypothetical protein
VVVIGHAARMRWIGCIVLLGIACGGDDGGTESASGTMSGSASESGSESGSESSSASEADTTTNDDLACREAVDVTTCMTAGAGAEVCQWLAGSTWVGGNGGTCMSIDVEPSGICAVDETDDGCITPAPSCPDEITSVWYREVGLEIGAIELVSFIADDICDGVEGFMPCMYDPNTETYTPPECSCICPMGG